MRLTAEQQQKILDQFKKTPDLMEITRVVFNNPELDGRTKEGRAVRAFLAEQGKQYDTASFDKGQQIELTHDQKQFLLSDAIEVGMNALEAARLVFKDEGVVSLSSKHRVVVEFLKKFRPEILNEADMIAKNKWQAPDAISRIIMKVNKFTGSKFDEETISTKEKKMMEQLRIYLNSPRFNHFINQYATEGDRELFESEYVRAIWDKPDLTNDELNLYITVCTNYVRQKHIQQRLDKLNQFLRDSESERDVTMRLTESIKATGEELNQCEKRIESVTKDLNGSRQQRLKEKGKQNGSIFALVEAFMAKEERDRMVKMAEMQNKLIEEEVDRLESMDEFKARIFGISKEELT